MDINLAYTSDTTTWTADEERILTALQSKKQTVEQNLRDMLEKLIDQTFPFATHPTKETMSTSDMADGLIDNSEDFAAILQRFAQASQ